MSYLDAPRLSFVGRFRADPPTRNNNIANYDPGHPGIGEPGDWNPDGTGAFEFHDCTVRSAMDAEHALFTRHAQDRLIGARVDTTVIGDGSIPRQRGNAKIVDLDPSQRRVSTLYGVAIRLSLSGEEVGFQGKLEPTSFRDYWKERAAGQGFRAGTIFQTVVTGVEWHGDLERSTVLQQLCDSSGDTVSIKLNVDDYHPIPNSPQFLFGRVTGTIGPYIEGEPQQFVSSRRLRQTESPDTSKFWPAPWKLIEVGEDSSRIVVDLGNSVQWVANRGESHVLQLWAAILPGAPTEPIEVLPTVFEYSRDDYEKTAGIVEAELSALQATRLKSNRLGLLQSSDATEPVLAEHASGKYVDIEPWVMRLDPGDGQQVDVYATRWGEPLAGEDLPFGFVDQPNYEINIPANALTLTPDPLTTGANGRATLTVSAADASIAGLPADRQYLHSQVYLLGDVDGWQAWGQVGPPPTPPANVIDPFPVAQKSGILSVLLFDSGPDLGRPPTWNDVRPLFERYADHFPAMTRIINLANESSVRAFAGRIAQLLTLDLNDGNYMPVTRDLAAYHRDLMLAWLTTGSPGPTATTEVAGTTLPGEETADDS